MASFENAESISVVAATDFTGDLHKLANITAANTADVADLATDIVAGIIGEEVLLGQEVPLVMLKGRVKVLAGGVVTAGQICHISGTTGGVETVATIVLIPANTQGLGIALSSGVAGEVVEMLAMPIGADAA